MAHLVRSPRESAPLDGSPDSHDDRDVARDHVNQEKHVRFASQRAELLLIVIDGDGKVVLDSIKHADPALRLLLNDDGTKLRENLDNVVRRLIDERRGRGEHDSSIAFLDVHRFARLTRLEGRDEELYAVSIEHVRGGDSLSRAARKYSLTRREVDVLALLLEGANASEIAFALCLAETTVQGYVKRLLSKTESRNRPALVANVLDWKGAERRGRNG